MSDYAFKRVKIADLTSQAKELMARIAGGALTPDEVIREVVKQAVAVDGECSFHTIRDKETRALFGVMAARRFDCPTRNGVEKRLEILFLEAYKDNNPGMFESLLDYCFTVAGEQGCDTLAITGRPGWQRRLRKFHFSCEQVLMVRRVD